MRKLITAAMFIIGAFVMTGCNVFTVGTGGDYADFNAIPSPSNGGPQPGDEVELVSDLTVSGYSQTIRDWDNVALTFNGYKIDVTGNGDGLTFFDSDYTRIVGPRIYGDQSSSYTDGSAIVFTSGSDWNYVRGGNIEDFNKGAVQGIPGRYNYVQRNSDSFGPIAVIGNTDTNGDPTTIYKNFNKFKQVGGPSIISYYQPWKTTAAAPTNAVQGWDWPGGVWCDFVVKDLQLYDIDDYDPPTLAPPGGNDGNGVILDDWEQTQTSTAHPNNVPAVTGETGCVTNIHGSNLASDYGKKGSVTRWYKVAGNTIVQDQNQGHCWASDASCPNVDVP